MVEIGFPDMLSLAQTIGIVGTMILTLYFSKKQIQSLAIDQQTRVLNDLDEKFLRMAELSMEDPSIQKVIDNQGSSSRELAFSFYILWICSHAYSMRQRKVLNDIEWTGWQQWMSNCFRKGTLRQTWKQIEADRWFDPAFQDFINKQIVPSIGNK
ncbi:MAG: hypothetical protein JO327_09410 [Nitrososphaeraceae archaeon]|nr:hypothetical protein [Nitrososphaeraceae archaeon]MBV9668333.1 hypothetical protein [Nitrososphaeraceae archaeon]